MLLLYKGGAGFNVWSQGKNNTYATLTKFHTVQLMVKTDERLSRNNKPYWYPFAKYLNINIYILIFGLILSPRLCFGPFTNQ